VLYVPIFNFNLISISKLLSNLPNTLIFSHDFCKIQDMNSLKVISLAKLQEERYHLATTHQPEPTSSLVTHSITAFITTSNLWHFRLGNLPRNYLDVLHQQFPSISKSSNETCDVCHLAKQKRLSYLPSNNRASKVYEVFIWIFGVFFF